MKSYDVVIGEQFGILCGKRNLVFIKTGRGGTIEGYENKYLNICSFLAEWYGCSIVVSANPVDSVCDLLAEIEQISEYVDYDEIYYIGVSDGASIGAEQCWKVDKIKNALLINGPLMINPHKTKHGAERFKGELMCFAYGDQDPSYRYVELLDGINNDACKHITLVGEDHRLSDDMLEFTFWCFLNERMYAGEKFKVNDSNRCAYEAVQDAERIACDYDHPGRLLYIFGKKGTGKSHMLYALMNSGKHEGFRVQLDDAADVGSEEDDVECYSWADIVMIDDVNQLAGDSEKLEVLKDAIKLTGVEKNFKSENNLILILTSDSAVEDTFEDNELVEWIRKGTVVKIEEGVNE